MKNSVYDAALRRWFPKKYLRRMQRRTRAEYRQKCETAKSPNDRREIEYNFDQDMENWRLWRQSIDDDELVAKAARMDLSLYDVPLPQIDGKTITGHWNQDDPRADVLYRESRRALEKAMRERAPSYRKERREIYEIYSKIVLGMSGLGGTIIGIISILKK
jgi:hypothetical protein